MQALPFHSPSGFESRDAPPSGESERSAHWFVFRGDRLLVEVGRSVRGAGDDPRVAERPSWARLLRLAADPGVSEGPYDAPHKILGSEVLRTLYVGSLDGVDCRAAEIAGDAPAPPGLDWLGLRSLFSVLDDRLFALAGRALQLVDWDRTHRYCGRCGAPTASQPDERVRKCPACGLASYPRIAPAVMALVRRGDELLLGRSPHFPPGMYSALAGFVEPGESLEQCVAREVSEEVGIEVTNLAYFASQPWPFPHSLMIAFTCDWLHGEIRPREGEIEAANWFKVFQLPKLPSRISIARRLIDAVAGEMRKG